MQKTFLGRTDLRVSVIGFGGLLFWKLSIREAKRVIEVALDEGVNLIDTAQAYGDSEAKIGAGNSTVNWKRMQRIALSAQSVKRNAPTSFPSWRL